MLRNLLVREWILNRTHLFIVLGMVLAFETYFVIQIQSTRLWLISSCAYFAFLTFVPFSREDKFQSAASTCALPVTRRDVVLSRWIGAWILVVATLILSAGLGTALPWSQIDLAVALEPANLLVGATVVTLILLLMLPFTIRFGLLGLLIFMVAAQVLGSAVFLTAILFGRAGASSRGAVRNFIDTIVSAFAAYRDALTSLSIGLIAILALAALNWIGYRFAVALYRRREF